MGRITTFAVLLACISLAGCFQSDEPLISAPESVTPIQPGRYASSDDPAASLTVKIQDTRTRIEESTDPDTFSLLFRKLKDRYFVAMLTDEKKDGAKKGITDSKQAESRLYLLFWVSGATFKTYQANCKDIETLADAAGRPLSTYGVVRVSAGWPKREGSDRFANNSCFFDSFDGIAKAYAALLEAGAIKADKTYRLANSGVSNAQDR